VIPFLYNTSGWRHSVFSCKRADDLYKEQTLTPGLNNPGGAYGGCAFRQKHQMPAMQNLNVSHGQGAYGQTTGSNNMKGDYDAWEFYMLP